MSWRFVLGWMAGALAAMGCGRLGFDAASRTDATPASDATPDSDAPGPSLEDFTDPRVIGPVVFDAQLSADHLELWGGDAPFDARLVTARRSTDTGVFAPAIEAALSPAAADTDPAFTSDGLHVIFVSTRGGTSSIWTASRASTAVAFGAPALVPGLETVIAETIDLVGDNVLYIADEGVLTRAERAAPGAPFDAPEPVAFAEFVRGPTLSGDELGMIYNEKNGVGLMWATRAARDQPFVDRGAFTLPLPGCQPSNLADPDISPDGARLIVRCNDLIELRR